MLTGTCHCGAIRIEIPNAPETLTNCNCSICRRLGTLWAYYPASTVTIHGHPEHTEEYIQGDRMLRLLRCKTCGCVTHWEGIDPAAGDRMGINIRNFEPALVQGARLKLLDGATTWTSVFADELVVEKRRVNRPWHDAHPMPDQPSLEQRIAWHRAHALACACRPVPEAIREAIAAQEAARV